MSFFSKYFGRRHHHPEEWGVITTAITKNLQEDRTLFFTAYADLCFKRPPDAEQPPIPNTTLAGSADLSIRAFQLVTVTYTIAENRYVPPSQGKDFADILYAQVCGAQIYDVMKYVRKYDEAVSDRTKMMIALFSLDLIDYIVGTRTPEPPYSPLLLDLSFHLRFNTVLTVANAFNDEVGIRRTQAAREAYLAAQKDLFKSFDAP